LTNGQNNTKSWAYTQDRRFIKFQLGSVGTFPCEGVGVGASPTGTKPEDASEAGTTADTAGVFEFPLLIGATAAGSEADGRGGASACAEAGGEEEAGGALETALSIGAAVAGAGADAEGRGGALEFPLSTGAATDGC
jgi:hypothetical protein